MGIWSSPSFQQTCIICCSFSQCEATKADNSDGACLIVWSSNAAIGCSNTLFANSHSAFHGGAISYNIDKTVPHKKSISLFSFCFFHKNICNVGNDVYLLEWTPDIPFLHSFSTTFSSRVCYVSSSSVWNNPSAYQNKDDWLPNTSMNHNVTV